MEKNRKKHPPLFKMVPDIYYDRDFNSLRKLTIKYPPKQLSHKIIVTEYSGVIDELPTYLTEEGFAYYLSSLIDISNKKKHLCEELRDSILYKFVINKGIDKSSYELINKTNLLTEKEKKEIFGVNIKFDKKVEIKKIKKIINLLDIEAKNKLKQFINFWYKNDVNTSFVLSLLEK